MNPGLIALKKRAVIGTNQTLSLLHFNAANGSTTYTDQAGLVWTQQDTCPISTTQYKFGGSSLFPNIAGAISTPYSANVDLLSLPAWTVECFVYSTSSPNNQRIFSTSGGAVGWDNTNGIHMLLQGVSGAPYLQVSNGTSSPLAITGGTFTVSAWNHVAVSLDTTGLRLYLNGSQVATQSAPTGIVRPSTNPSAEIARLIGQGSGNDWPGYIDEFRLSSVARYTGSTYTVPTAEFSYPG